MSRIHTQVSRIIDAGALGRSSVYRRLLRYLADASIEGTIPKEIDIATDVLNKTDFDPASDSTVRVYVHKLRRKIDDYYAKNATAETRIRIPKGQYQVQLEDEPEQTSADVVSSRKPVSHVALAALLLIAVFFLGRISTDSPHVSGAFEAAPVWTEILNDDRSVVIVVGDYYMFSEGSESVPGSRLIRDFFINSEGDLEAWIDADPSRRREYYDIQLSYLPLGIAAALGDVLNVIGKSNRAIEIIPQSEFRVSMLRRTHVIYLGYVSGLGTLSQFAFASSRLAIGASFDELVDMETGSVYRSSAGLVTNDDSNYTDYGFVSTFPGPDENQFLIITGLRDEGLMRMAETLASPADANALAAGLGSSAADAPAFEALYRVNGIDRTDVASTQVLEGPLDADAIWTFWAEP